MGNRGLFIKREGSGDPIVLLHGWGMNAAVFDNISADLARTREVVRLDLPGYGGSRWDPSLSFSEQAHWIASELPSADILGWSMGGLYALEMIRQKPTQFRRLYLVCCNPCFVSRDDWTCAVDAEIFDEFARGLRNGWEATVSRFLALQMHGSNNARSLIREMMASLKSAGEPDPQALEFGLQLLKQQDMRSSLAGFDIPVKMILGHRDALVPKALAKKIELLNPDIEVESLATAAHAPFLSHSASFLSLL